MDLSSRVASITVPLGFPPPRERAGESTSLWEEIYRPLGPRRTGFVLVYEVAILEYGTPKIMERRIGNTKGTYGVLQPRYPGKRWAT